MSDYAVTGQDKPVEPLEYPAPQAGLSFAIQIHVTESLHLDPGNCPVALRFLILQPVPESPHSNLYRITNLATRLKENVIARESCTLFY